MTYQEHVASRQAERNNNANGFVKSVFFLGEFFANNVNSVVVRFPYHSKEDFTYTNVHTIKDYPGFKYGKSVVCTGKDTCPLCAAGMKKIEKSVVKMIAYTIENGKVVPHDTIWERNSAWVDIDLANKANLYGDLTTRLFMLTKSGVGTDTRYSLDLIDNPVVYPPEQYTADFTKLLEVDAEKICFKTYAQYQLALNPTASEASATPVATSPATTPDTVPFTVNDSAPQFAPQTASQPPLNFNTPTSAPTPAPEVKTYQQPAPNPNTGYQYQPYQQPVARPTIKRF